MKSNFYSENKKYQELSEKLKNIDFNLAFLLSEVVHEAMIFSMDSLLETKKEKI